MTPRISGEINSGPKRARAVGAYPNHQVAYSIGPGFNLAPLLRGQDVGASKRLAFVTSDNDDLHYKKKRVANSVPEQLDC